jgi:hypothetical protein
VRAAGPDQEPAQAQRHRHSDETLGEGPLRELGVFAYPRKNPLQQSFINLHRGMSGQVPPPMDDIDGYQGEDVPRAFAACNGG